MLHRALRVEKLDDAELAALVAAEGLEQLHPERGTRPSVHYKNLHRFNKAFIGGSAVTRQAGLEDCAKDATVALFRGEERLAETTTDAFGDFRFDHLDVDSGAYRVEVTLGERTSGPVLADLGKSLNLGVIPLT